MQLIQSIFETESTFVSNVVSLRFESLGQFFV